VFRPDTMFQNPRKCNHFQLGMYFRKQWVSVATCVYWLAPKLAWVQYESGAASSDARETFASPWNMGQTKPAAPVPEVGGCTRKTCVRKLPRWKNDVILLGRHWLSRVTPGQNQHHKIGTGTVARPNVAPGEISALRLAWNFCHKFRTDTILCLNF